MKKSLRWILGLVLLLVIASVLWVLSNLNDRHPGYSMNISVDGKEAPVIYSVGFGKSKITPTLLDTWIDENNNAKFDDGEEFIDANENGSFDAIWIAGFHNNKPANGIHDDVWSRAVVLDDGLTRIALVSIDAIGFMYTDVIDIRNMIPKELGIDYTLIASTHTHESNDLIGLWGPNIFHSGVDGNHMNWLKKQVISSIKSAVQALKPATFIFGQDLSDKDSILIKDTRKPIVKATGIQIMQVLNANNDSTMGTLVNWSNHPESLWSKNTLISSDYPHYIREALEKGITHNNRNELQGMGGTSVFFSGVIGGLMAPHSSLTVRDSIRQTDYLAPSYEKARAIGEQVAIWSVEALQKSDTIKKLNPINIFSKTFELPVHNRNFRIASAIGLLDRGMHKWFKTRTEVCAIKAGPVTFLSIPGEIYPEIIYGGIENPPGQDYSIEPLEVPPLKDFMPGKYHFYLGLSNDEVGYIIPKSEWDAEEPWLYINEGDTYGEENSLGPETAPIIYSELKKVLQNLSSNQ